MTTSTLTCWYGSVSSRFGIDALTMKFQPFFSGSVAVASEDIEDEAKNDDAPVVDEAEEQGNGTGGGGIQPQPPEHEYHARLRKAEPTRREGHRREQRGSERDHQGTCYRDRDAKGSCRRVERCSFDDP